MNNRKEASYLLRFDDICPTMKWSNWAPIEAILDDHGIKPIMAVIPDNRDTTLHIERPDPSFWDRVRHWQASGWTIGMHGFQHTYVTRRPGLYSNRRASEFAGLPRREQREKLERGLFILRSEGVFSELWIAPGHSFDSTTVSLLREVGIVSISDGYSMSPYTDKQGILWIPQQLSEKQLLSKPGRKPNEPKRAGVWTVCFHANSWTRDDINLFREAIGKYKGLISTTKEIQEAYKERRRNWRDRLHAAKLEAGRHLRLVFENPPEVHCEASQDTVGACAGALKD